jgi:hypothetical protein
METGARQWLQADPAARSTGAPQLEHWIICTCRRDTGPYG